MGRRKFFGFVSELWDILTYFVKYLDYFCEIRAKIALVAPAADGFKSRNPLISQIFDEFSLKKPKNFSRTCVGLT